MVWPHPFARIDDRTFFSATSSNNNPLGRDASRAPDFPYNNTERPMPGNQPNRTHIIPDKSDCSRAVEVIQKFGILLTPAEAAERLGVTERVLERLRMTGEGPDFVKLTSKTLRYRQEDLEAFVINNVRRSTAQ